MSLNRVEQLTHSAHTLVKYQVLSTITVKMYTMTVNHNNCFGLFVERYLVYFRCSELFYPKNKLQHDSSH